MLIESLVQYHHQQMMLKNPDFAPNGMELKNIHFVIVLNLDGIIMGIEQPKKKQFVSKSQERSGKGAASIANRLWDHAGYVLGYSVDEKLRDAALIQNRSFIALVKEIAAANPQNRQLEAVVKFYERGVDRLHQEPLWSAVAAKIGQNISFRIEGEQQLLCQHIDVVGYDGQAKMGRCSITGVIAPLIHTHPKVRIYGGVAVGAKLISFNKECGYDSYRQVGSNNAPMSIDVAESYASTLNGLLQFDSPNKIIIGTVSFVFFSLSVSDLDKHLAILLGAVEGNRAQVLKALQDNIEKYAKVEMVVAALIPNAARISVRMFEQINGMQLISNILKFYADAQLDHKYIVTDQMTLMMPLLSISFESDVTRLAPQLIVDYIEAVLTNQKMPAIFPQELLKCVKNNNNKDLMLCSMIKCYLVRNFYKSDYESYDALAKNKGYLLGVMFSVMDKIKRQGARNAPAIRFSNTYYNALATTPSMVFDRLVELSYSFIRGIRSQSTSVLLQAQLDETIQINRSMGIPPRLSLDEQCHFVLGYFLGRQTYSNQLHCYESN